MAKSNTFGMGLAVAAVVAVAGLGWLAGLWAQNGGAREMTWEYEVISVVEIEAGANRPRGENRERGVARQFNGAAEARKDQLDALGKRGWELVEATDGWLYLKRPARPHGME